MTSRATSCVTSKPGFMGTDGLGADVVVTPEGDMRLASPQNISGTQDQAPPAPPRRK
ncbi:MULTISPECIES: hypothetical protein [Myxococcus]|uniref:hypothetical protein n=1 Tax=Myxococcus TaxID=32 RepID=UPI001396A79D|nr:MULTISPECIES: hypothetical protein [Myxococcus]WAM25331.1 hypothetical protein OZ403_33170 [Myxococcus sp. NMCA1]